MHGVASAFVDGIAYFYCHENTTPINCQMLEELVKLRKCCFDNKTKMNDSKAEYVNFSLSDFHFKSDFKVHVINKLY